MKLSTIVVTCSIRVYAVELGQHYLINLVAIKL